MIQILKKIDFIKIVFLLVITAVFLMNATAYYHNCFPNCYSWKEMMIKWSNGEIVRRGLLGTIFYSLEPYIPVKFSATSFLYICLVICYLCIYNRLKKLKLPFWLMSSILLSPALFLFNISYLMLYRKDLIILAACVCNMLFCDYYWSRVSKKPNKLRDNTVIFSLIYLYFYILVLLCYELFIVFVPFICFYIFFITTKYNNLKFALKLSLFLMLISCLLFFILTLPYMGNQNIVMGIIRDWAKIYPDFQLVNADPLWFFMFDKQILIDKYSHFFALLKFSDLLLMYILMIIPLIVIFKLNYVRVDLPSELKTFYSKHHILCYFVTILVIHFPFSLSIVAFEFGRWFVFTLYLMVLFLCFFVKQNSRKKITFWQQSRVMVFICFALSIIYIITWCPHHWVQNAGDYLVTLDQYVIAQRLYYFYSEPHNLLLMFND